MVNRNQKGISSLELKKKKNRQNKLFITKKKKSIKTNYKEIAENLVRFNQIQHKNSIRDLCDSRAIFRLIKRYSSQWQ